MRLDINLATYIQLIQKATKPPRVQDIHPVTNKYSGSSKDYKVSINDVTYNWTFLTLSPFIAGLFSNFTTNIKGPNKQLNSKTQTYILCLMP